MIHTSTSEVAVTENMLSELTKYLEEMEEGGDNVSDTVCETTKIAENERTISPL